MDKPADETRKTDQLQPSHQKTLREAAFVVAKEMRELLDSLPDDLSADEQRDLILDEFDNRFWKRLQHIKDRMSVIAPYNGVKSASAWLPSSKDNLRNIIDALERESTEFISDDVLL
jgi:hypothetical protein